MQRYKKYPTHNMIITKQIVKKPKVVRGLFKDATPKLIPHSGLRPAWVEKNGYGVKQKKFSGSQKVT